MTDEAAVDVVRGLQYYHILFLNFTNINFKYSLLWRGDRRKKGGERKRGGSKAHGTCFRNYNSILYQQVVTVVNHFIFKPFRKNYVKHFKTIREKNLTSVQPWHIFPCKLKRSRTNQNVCHVSKNCVSFLQIIWKKSKTASQDSFENLTICTNSIMNDVQLNLS